ncbi:MAG: TatD family hydrolase [Kiritimatiellia bacterium]|jgi:TatD DNase family protein
MLYDAHVHLQSFPAAMLPTVMARARAAGVGRFGCCGTSPADWDRVMAIAQAEPGVEPSCGLHPWHCADPAAPADWLERLEALLAAHPGLGVGEIGLDALRPDPEAQMQAFREQLALAAREGRAVALHCVRAHGEMIEALRPIADALPRMLLHGAACSSEIWREHERLGVCVSIGPAVLNPRSRRIRELARIVPEGRLFFETDAPDMAINGCAVDDFGGRNAPENLPRIIAEVRRIRAEG